LDFVQKHPRRCRLQEKGNKRSVAISHVETVETAVALLEEIGKEETMPV